MTSFLDAYTRWNDSNKNERSNKWSLCVAAHDERKPAAKLADIIGIKADTIENWITVGWLIEYTAGVTVCDEQACGWYLVELWEKSDTLSYDHLLRAAKQAKRLELSPDTVLEYLYYAADSGQNAEAMERDIREAHEEEKVIGLQDLRTMRKRLQQNFGSVKFRKFISDETARLWSLLDKSLEMDLKQLEAK